jgi:hypothetical protein
MYSFKKRKGTYQVREEVHIQVRIESTVGFRFGYGSFLPEERKVWNTRTNRSRFQSLYSLILEGESSQSSISP